jgi:glycerol-3-phosphate acyltransferase PlsY
MKPTVEMILAVITAYLAGSLPSAQIFSSLFRPGTNLKEEGTGNVGTENAWLVAGPAAGLCTALFDFSKGALVITAAHFFLGWSFQTDLLKLLILSLFVIIGHDYPVWLKFRGGLGFACITSTLLYLNFASWFAGIIILALTLFVRDRIRKVAAQHFLAGMTIPVTSVLLFLQEGRDWPLFQYSVPYFLGDPIRSSRTLFAFSLLYMVMYYFQRTRYRGLMDDIRAGIHPWRALWMRMFFEMYPAESAWKGPNPDEFLLTDEAVFGRRTDAGGGGLRTLFFPGQRNQ